MMQGSLVTRAAAGESALSFMHPDGDDSPPPGAPLEQ